jgi:ribonuclease-3
MEAYIEFQNKIGVSFNDINLLRQACTHRSYINEQKESGLSHNERLEFLGDAVLELVITDFLFNKFPDTDEGILTAYRSSLVRTETISQAARDLGMNDLLLLSKGESRDQGKARDYILANTYEALIGAIYLDAGYNSAAKVIGDTLFDNIDEVIAERSWKDAKSYVQECAQEHYSLTPRYELMGSEGPDHSKEFVMAIYFGDKKIAEGKGKSKQQAQQEAAQNAIELEGWDQE